MISKVPCCKSPVKSVKRAAQRAQKQRKLEYTLPYTVVERQAMHLLGNVGKTQREVASLLNVDRRTVQRQMKKFRETNTFLNKEKKGRQSKLTELRLTAWVEEDRRSTSCKLSRMAKEAFGVDVTELLWEEVDRRIKLKKRRKKMSLPALEEIARE
jgi:transposase